MKNIVLFGFMGTGKSLIARKLRDILGLEVIDMDTLIQQREGKSISKIFAENGEPYFREIEKKTAIELAEQQGVIISTGGGVVLNEENIKNLSKNGVCVCLQAEPETIFERVKPETHRPLLQTDNPLETIKNILNKRKINYLKVPYKIVTDNKTPEQICEEILNIYNKI
ncbi:shikimate kinase [bacterium]|nr:shikimate kinase [bacterium]